MVESLKAKMAALDESSDSEELDPKAALAKMMAGLSTKPKTTGKATTGKASAPVAKSTAAPYVALNNNPHTLEEAWVKWNFDGQVRHRINNETLKGVATVVDRAKRKEAAGKTTDFRTDKLITYLTENAEAIFEPKRILHDRDWLKSFKEPDQFYEKYAKCTNGSHKWIKPG